MSDQPEMESMTEYEAAEGIEALLGEPDEVTEEVTDVAEEATDVAEEATTAEDAEEEAEEAEPDEDSEEPGSIETLSELAEALELPIEEVMANLKTSVKVNGEEQEVTLKEAFDGYQKDADYRQKTQELADNRRGFEQQAQQAQQVIENQNLQIGAMLQHMQQMVVPQLDQAQMEYLRDTDPAQYVIAKNDHAEKSQQFQQLMAASQNQLQQVRGNMQYQSQAQKAEMMARAAEELPTRVPDWGAERKQAIDQYLTSDHYGYNEAELAMINDPRLVELANKAFLYDQGQQAADVVTKKVKTLPKIQSSAAKLNKPKGSSLKKAQQRLKKSGSLDDAAAGISELLF